MDLRFLPKLLLQHDSSPQEVLEDVQTAFLHALRLRQVHAVMSPSGDGLAVALGQRLAVLTGLAGRAPPHVEFATATDAPEAVTALTWLAAAGGQSAGDECILAGTSTGFLQLHSPTSGALLLRQQLHHSAAVCAVVRWSGAGIDPEDLSEDVTLGFTDAVVRLPTWEVWAAARWAKGRGGGGPGGWWPGGGGGGGGSPVELGHHRLSFAKFQLPKGAGPRSHAVCLGPPPPSLHSLLTGRPPPPRVRVLTAGSAPPLAAYEGEEAAAQGLLSLVSDLASSTASSLLGAARSYVPGQSLLRGLRRGRGAGPAGGRAAAAAGDSAADLAQQGQAVAGSKGGEKIPAEPAVPQAAVWDEKRSVTQMALSPCGRLAACCDSLGRILLADTAQTLVVRMLKGYREAQVAWLACGGGGGSSARQPSLPSSGLLGGSASSLDSSYQSMNGSAADLAGTAGAAGEAAPRAAAGEAGEAGSQRQGRVQGASCRHLLVIYAPRRASVEVWEPLTLARLASIKCSVTQGLLLQQPVCRVGGGATTAAAGGSGDRPSGGRHTPNRVMLLDGAALTLTDLTETLAAAL